MWFLVQRSLAETVDHMRVRKDATVAPVARGNHRLSKGTSRTKNATD